MNVSTDEGMFDVSGALAATLEGTALWLTADTVRSGGPRGAKWRVRTEAGDVLLEARTYAWRRSFDVVCATTRRTMLTVRSSLLFPLTGRADILRGGTRIGLVHRSGRFANATGAFEGRFRDARTARERTREGVLQGAFELVLDADSSSGEATSASSFVCEIGGRAAGTLHNRRRPEHWAQDAVERGPRVLPDRLRRLIGTALAARGWQLRLEHGIAGDDAVILTAAAIFTLVLART